MRHLFCIILLLHSITNFVVSQTLVTIDDVENWTTAELQPYIGQTIQSGKKRFYDHFRAAKKKDKTDSFHLFLQKRN